MDNISESDSNYKDKSNMMLSNDGNLLDYLSEISDQASFTMSDFEDYDDIVFNDLSVFEEVDIHGIQIEKNSVIGKFIYCSLSSYLFMYLVPTLKYPIAVPLIL